MKLKNLGKLILTIGIFSCAYLPFDVWGQCGNGTYTVLHYTETSAYNHNTRNQSLAMFQAIGQSNNFTVVNDETGDEFNSLANLQRFAVVIFSNTSGDNILDATQRANFEAYIRGGGSYVGIHAASDTYRHSSANGSRTGTWDWYAENVAGCSVQQSPNHTSANHNNDMTHQLPGHPVLVGLPDPWNKTEEYYYWEKGYLNSTFTEILRVKQTGGASYDIPRMTTHVKVLPTGGRAFYTALGHSRTNFTNDQQFQTLLTNGVKWAADPNIGSGGGGLNITGSPRDATCGDNDGAIDISVSGGSGTYTYLWSNNDTKQDIVNLLPGTYTVQVDDGRGCVDNESFTVGSTGTKPQLSLNVDQQISCYGANDGSISSSVIGNSRTYSYLWNSGKTSPDLTGLNGGFYELVVSTPVGCKDTASVTLQEPDSLHVSIQVIQSPTCTDPSGGILRSTARGGSGTLRYRWNTGAISAGISGLGSGQYILTVEDARGCTKADTVLLESNSFDIDLTVSKEISCFGLEEGEISAIITGGKSPFIYTWNNRQTGRIASNLGAGMYILTVVDAEGCTERDSLVLTEPDTLIIQANTLQEISCFGATDGSIGTSVSGGTRPFTYLWDTGASASQLNGIGSDTYIVTVTDALGCVDADTLALNEPDSLKLSLREVDAISCNGGTDAAVEILVEGGIPTYTYLWSSGQTSPNLQNISAGTYTLTVEDVNNCEVRESINISEPDALSGTINLDQGISCAGGSDGSLSVSMTGGTPGYTYAWAAGSTSAIASNLTAGFQAVEVTDSQGCVWTDSLAITEPSALVLSATQTAPASCNGAANGAASVQVSGGTGSYTYLWPDGQTNATATALMAGIYTVKVQDVNGCEDSTTVSINNNIPWTLALTETSSLECYGDSSAAISAQIQSGVNSAPFTYLWSTGGTGTSISGLSANTYSLTVTDKDGCEANESLQITEPDSLDLTFSILQQISCYGVSDGSVSARASGGTAPYTYVWSNGQTGTIATGLAAGTVSVEIQDINGCSKTFSLVLSQPDSIGLTLTQSADISCNGALDAAISSVVLGGSQPYSYSWSSGQTTPDIAGINAGTYTLTLTDGSTCSTQKSITISEPDALSGTINLDQGISCAGGSDGSLSVSMTGGTPGYTYAWAAGSTSAIASNLTAGFQVIEVTDSQGCVWKDSLAITEPSALVLSATQTAPASCNGAASVQVSGGTGSYTYLWPDGQTNATATALMAGIYTVKVQDVNGCEDSTTVSINNNIPWTLALTETSSLECYGDSSAAISAQIQSGVNSAPFTYLWSTGATGTSISGLSANTYSLTVTDKDGCEANESLQITEPDSLDLTFSILQQISCYGVSDGSVSARASGGTAPYTYVWSNGQTGTIATGLAAGTVSVEIQDINGCSKTFSLVLSQPDSIGLTLTQSADVSCNGALDAAISSVVLGGSQPYSYSWSSGQTTPDIAGINAGTYTLTLTDGSTCSTQKSITISEPDALSGTINLDQGISCAGGSDGSLSVSMTGGTPGYTYAWAAGSTSAIASNLTAGFQVIEVTDSQGCVWTDSLAITEPTPLVLSATQTAPASCNGAANGAASVQVSGGTGSYTYLWPDGQTNATATALMAGIYTVKVQDVNGCEDSTTVSINNNIPWTLALTETSSLECYGDSSAAISAQIQSGVNSAPFTYLWSTGATGTSISGLSANTYSLTVTDKDGCEANESLQITEPDSLDLTFSILQQISCYGVSDGSVSARASGGTAPYTYVWSNGQTGTIATGLAAGTVSVEIQDINGCSKTFSLVLSQPDSIGLTLTQSADVSCNGALDAAISSVVLGGSQPYSYSWSSGQTTPDIAGINAGTYTLTLTDGSTCSTQKSITISEPDALSGTINLDQGISCAGGSDGSLSVSMTGGTPSYTYAWAAGSTSAIASNLTAGFQVIEVTDSQGCVWTDSLAITEPTPLVLSATQTAPASCNGAANGEASVQVSGGTGSYTYLWPNGQTTATATALMAGIYTVKVQDANGCEDSTTVSINNNIPWTLALTETSSLECYGDSSAAISAQIQSGVNSAPFTYLWSTGATGTSISGLSANTYSLTVTDKDGCEANETWVISAPDSMTIDLSISSPISCFEANDGSISSLVSGGTGPYTYVWSNGETTASSANWSAGTATVTVTDANGCSKSKSIELTEPQAIRITLSQVDPISCNGMSDGSIFADVAGGSPSYSYLWSNGQTTPTATDVGAGWQVLSLTDGTGCQIKDSLLLEEPAAISANFTELSSLSCNGDSTGAIQVVANGGSPGYSYLWITNDTASSISNLVAASYSVRITDSEECFVNLSYTLTEPAAIDPRVAISQTISCFGDTTGSIEASPLGGATPYTFLWSNGSTSPNIANIGAGTYTLDITDANACSVQETVELTEPEALGLSMRSVEDVSCQGGNDGTASIFINGGFPTFTYLWSDGQTTSRATNLSAGSYTVVVSDQNSCVDSLDILIQEPAEILAELRLEQEIICAGDSNGIMSVEVSGGFAPYTYVWTNGDTSQRASQLSAGVQSVSITDSRGCVKSFSDVLTEPAPLQAFISIQSDISCVNAENGSLKVQVSGGNFPYTYLWSTGSRDTLISNLSAGRYAVTITDRLGCSQTMDTVLSPPLEISSSIQITQAIDCNGASNASIELSLQGGKAPFSFLWQDGISLQNRTGLSMGVYSVLIRDANNCVQRDSIVITQPDVLETEMNLISDVSCAGLSDGIAEVLVRGGSAPYNVLWTNDSITLRADNLPIGTQYVQITDANNCVTADSIVISSPSIIETSLEIVEPIACANGENGAVLASASGGVGTYSFIWSNGQTDSLATALSSQTYQVLVQDENGCVIEDSIFLSEPTPLSTLAVSLQDASCDLASDGAGYVEVSGGVAPYEYNWTNGTMQDSLLGVSPGRYIVQITDSLNCVIEDSVQIGETLSWEASVSVLDSVSCFGFRDGAATASVNGSGVYTYLWKGGQTADTVRSLSAGVQNLEISDNFGCRDTVSFTIEEPDSLKVFASLILPSPDLSNGSIEIDAVENGIAPFSYVWSNGATDEKIDNLPTGAYQVLVVDNKGCEASQTFDLDSTSFLWDEFEATADIQRNRVQLNWSTLREKDNETFSIERSIDNIIFENIIEEPSGGDATSRQTYESFDLEPFANRNFYRLKQTFKNGQFSYFSEVREVVFSDNRPGYLIAYPMPLRRGELMFVELEMRENSDAYIYIFNALGQRVYQTLIKSPEGRRTLEIPSTSLSPGLYYLSLTNETETYMYQIVIY